MISTGPTGAIVFAWLLACTPAREPDTGVVDVVVSAESASALATTASAAPITKLAVGTEVSASSSPIDDDPRRVLRPPLPPPLLTGSSLPPQTALPLMPASVPMLVPILAQRVAADAPNMTPEGQPSGGSFKQGDTLQLPLTLQPGRCYTFVAVSNTITELDIALMVTPAPGMPLPATVLAMDSTTGSTAVVGAGKNCFKNVMPVPFPAMFVVRATTGAGSVLAQAFSR